MEKRVKAFIELGDFIREFLAGERNAKHQQLDELIDTCYQYNGWFNRENIIKALNGIALMLSENDLREFAKQVEPTENQKTVAVIMAGNIPAVGFHDFLCVLLSGNKILIKLSSDDKHLIPFFSEILIEFESSLKEQILFTEGKLEKFDAVIATGSSNSARYFEYYFGKYPYIIRKNRTSVAVLTGNETKEELALLGNDIFDYYGLGCRNVSKVFVPERYKLDTLFEGLFSFGHVIENKKYGNNYEYNRAVYLLNKEPFLDNNFLLIKRSENLHSPVGVLFYEEYTGINDLTTKIDAIKNELQCLVAGRDFPNENIVFGQAQCPDIFTFSDNINMVAFLNNLK
ncbi:MAG TPA: acyl-CoA reductase [Bacteroidia bacterium]|jgi:hypothetical protein|nr:acyl-CoA reductase [Bacteroidia bacterium]